MKRKLGFILVFTLALNIVGYANVVNAEEIKRNIPTETSLNSIEESPVVNTDTTVPKKEDKVPVTGKSSSSSIVKSPNLVVQEMNISTQNAVKSGDIFKVSFKFTNNSDIVGKNIKFVLKDDCKKNLELLMNNNNNLISEIQPNGSYNMELSFKVLEKAVSGTYKIDVLAYIDENNPNAIHSYSFNIKIDNGENSTTNGTSPSDVSGANTTDTNGGYGGGGIDVGGGFSGGGFDDGGSSTLSGGNSSTTTVIKGGKPKLIVDNYSVSPKSIKAGAEFDLVLSFYNTNKNKSVKNIKVVLNSNNGSAMNSNSQESGQADSGNVKPTLNGSVFMPVNSSNTFYIDSIYAGSRTTKTIRLTTPYDISPNTYELGVHLEYEDGTDMEFESVEALGINLFQEAKVKLGTVQFPEAIIGMDSPISAELYNTGRSPVYNLMIKMSGNFETISDTYYIGNFQPGATENFSSSLTPTEPGKISGKLEISYEDSTGQPHEFTQEFSQEAMEMPMDPNMEGMEGMEGEQSLLKNPIFWGVIGLIAVIIITIIIRVKRKKKLDDELIIDTDDLKIEDDNQVNNKGNKDNED